MGYIRIKHKIVEEHFSNTPEEKPVVKTTGTSTVKTMAIPESCTTVAAAHSTATVVKAKAITEPILKISAVDSVQIESLNLWTCLNDYNQRIVSASINNPAQVNYLKEKALTIINTIADFVSIYYGPAAGMAVLARLGSVEAALADVITAIAEQRDVAPFKAIADLKINELAELLDSANPVAWPKDALTGALNQYAMLTVDQLSAELRKDWPAANDVSETIKKLISTISGVFASGFAGKTPLNF